MEPGGEVERSVLRIGGWAGVLAGVFVIVAFISFPLPPADLEQDLATFSERITLAMVSSALFVVGILLLLVFLGALYWSLKKPSRVFARIGLGSGILGLVLFIVVQPGFLIGASLFSGLYADAAVTDRPVVVATYVAVVTFLRTGFIAGGLFTGLAFVAFGIAMRGSQDFQEGLAWLSVALGIVAVLVTLALAPVAIIAIAIFALVFGWKVYSLSRAA